MAQKRMAGLLLTDCTLVALAVGTRPPPGCHLQVIPDYVNPVSYRAVLRPSPECLPTVVLRVRKSSTVNRKAAGAPWQPIKPVYGAWEVPNIGAVAHNPVPYSERWMMSLTHGWHWQWYDAQQGHWVNAEVVGGE